MESLNLKKERKPIREPYQIPFATTTVFAKKGLSFISNRQRRKEGTFCASGLAGIEPTPPAPVEQGMRPSPTRLGGTLQPLIQFDFCLNSISAILKKEIEWAGGPP
jgi:hypothetical protein